MKRLAYFAALVLLSGVTVAQTGSATSGTTSDPQKTNNPADQQTGNTTSNPPATDRDVNPAQTGQPSAEKDTRQDSASPQSEGAPMSEHTPAGTTSTNPSAPGDTPSTSQPPADNPQPPADRVPRTDQDGPSPNNQPQTAPPNDINH